MNAFVQLLRAIYLQSEIAFLTAAVEIVRYNRITLAAGRRFLYVFFLAGVIAPPILTLLGLPTLGQFLAGAAIFACGYYGVIVALRTSLLVVGIDVVEGLTPEMIRKKISILHPGGPDNDTSSLASWTFKHSFLLGMWMLSVLLIPAMFPINNVGGYAAAMACAVILTYYAAYNFGNAKVWTLRLAMAIGALFAYSLGRMIFPNHALQFALIASAISYGIWAYHNGGEGKRWMAAHAVATTIVLLTLATLMFPGTFERLRAKREVSQASQSYTAEHERRLGQNRTAAQIDVDTQIENLDKLRINSPSGKFTPEQLKQYEVLLERRAGLYNPDAQIRAEREAAEARRVADHNRQIADLTQQIKNQDADIAKLEEQIEALEAKRDGAGLTAAEETDLGNAYPQRTRLGQLRDDLINKLNELSKSLPGVSTLSTSLATLNTQPFNITLPALPTSIPEPPNYTYGNAVAYAALALVVFFLASVISGGQKEKK